MTICSFQQVGTKTEMLLAFARVIALFGGEIFTALENACSQCAERSNHHIAHTMSDAWGDVLRELTRTASTIQVTWTIAQDRAGRLKLIWADQEEDILVVFHCDHETAQITVYAKHAEMSQTQHVLGAGSLQTVSATEMPSLDPARVADYQTARVF